MKRTEEARAWTEAGAGRPAAEKRRIFQILECGGPGGTGEQVAALCNRMDPERYETTLIYAVRPGNSAEAYRASARGAAKAVWLPLMVREISPAKDVRALIALYRMIKAGRPHVVHAHSSKAGFLARLAAYGAGVPVIYYSPRGYGFQMEDRSALDRALYKCLERSVSWIGQVIAVSPSEAELARTLCWGKPVHVVPDAYLGERPTEPYGAPPPAAVRRGPGELRVGACGRLTHARNPEAFLRLARHVRDARDGVRFVWIGDGESAPKLRGLVADLNLSDRFELTGWLPRAQVRERLLELDLFVHFSRWEGLPNAVLEAMAAGLPVLASDVAGNRDAVASGETGLLAGSEAELLERALQLLDDPALRNRLGVAGRRRVREEFSLERSLQALNRLYGASRQ